ncbi:MAG: L-histidine N(alpha)-methyltransferase [Pirellulales bacterium]
MSVATMHTFLPTLPPVFADVDLAAFGRDVVAGLSRTPREIPSKYLHDRRGSQLFDLVCELPQYYPARAESAITREFADNIIDHIGQCITLIELGVGSSANTRLLLDRLAEASAYVAVDISQEHLLDKVTVLQASYEHLDIIPICADFSGEFAMPLPWWAPERRAVYFPGSAIGNFKSGDARRLMRRLSRLCGTGGRLIVGIDLDKNPATIEAAYNDPAGVSAEYHLNLLLRINRELVGGFDLDGFSHEAVYDRPGRRLESRLVSKWEQTALIGNRQFDFSPGDRITTQYSQKFTIDGFSRLAKAAGFAPEWCWFDEREYFSVMCLVCER